MEEVLVWPAIIAGIGIACFVAGSIYGKAVVSEAATIKQHISTEIATLRKEIAGKIAG